MRRFFAIETGGRPNTFHAFPTVSARDWWVAKDPEHRAVVTSSSLLARRMLRADGHLWEMVGAEDSKNIHSAIPYLDR